MRIRGVLVVLGLLMFIFCSVGVSQAAIDNKYNFRFLAPPNEHPWQDSGSPPFEDTILPQTVSQVFIVIGPVKLIIIKPSRAGTVPNEKDDWPNGRVPR
ncbi:MAG: hypothetical protein KAW02_05200 [candidate division Zixibacteria bacterium]|nr:hypothetical protein [candidate division Zixibacteria bacterium]